jgi:ankyrin repeat protein
VKNLAISILISLLFISFAIDDALAQQQDNLHQAVINGDIDQIKSQLSAGTDVNLKNRMGWTLLETAIYNRKTEIIQLLLEKGADVNARDNRGRTPLHFAVETGQKDVIEQLIAKGAKVNEMDGLGNNALSMATKSNQTEIAELLKKNGAQEPDPQALSGDRLYSSPGRPPIATPSANYARSPQPVNVGGNVNQPSVTANLLADPNEIKARIKTFDGLEKALKDVSDKGQNEMHQWEQNRYDNRTILSRAVDRQFDDEIDLIRKAAVEESAKKTVAAIDSLLTTRHERSSKINKELLEQRRQERLTASANSRTRGRGRTSGRTARGRTSVRGQSPGANTTNQPYSRGAAAAGPGGYGAESANQPAEQLDPQTQEQMRLWLQATPDNKLELAKQIHPQMQAELSSIRTIAVEENAKKTTAAIDGVLLARQERFDELVKKVEEQRRKLQEEQNLRGGTGVQNQANPYGGQTSGREAQRGNLQNGTRGTRTRRR